MAKVLLLKNKIMIIYLIKFDMVTMHGIGTVELEVVGLLCYSFTNLCKQLSIFDKLPL